MELVDAVRETLTRVCYAVQCSLQEYQLLDPVRDLSVRNGLHPEKTEQ